MNLYREESANAKYNAQRNLSGRTHYVDDDTLRFHKSRILRTHITDNGLLFGLIESCALDMNNTSRGFRPVIFDIFGTVINERAKLEDCLKTRAAAEKAFWREINNIDAGTHTILAIEEHKQRHIRECNEMRDKVRALITKKAV